MIRASRRRLVAHPCHDKTDQGRTALAAQIPDRGATDPWLRPQCGLDLADLDAIAADFHLGVAAPQVGVSAVGQAAHQVTGAVHATAGAQRVCDEPAGGQIWPAEVSAGQLRSGKVKLSHHAAGYRPQP